MLPLEDWSGSTIGNVPIGQGIAVTPMQMVAAYAAIANGGVRVTPHLVERSAASGAEADQGDADRLEAHGRPDDVDAPRTSCSEGTGAEAAIPGYTVAGKTGTAEKAENGRLLDTKYVASFVGFVPAKKPAARVLVMVDEPRGEHLRRRRRGAGVPRDRPLRAAVPRGAAGRARDARRR